MDMTEAIEKTVVKPEQFLMSKNNIKQILDSADMGIWRITLCDGQHPRMNASGKMLELLGLDKDCQTSEEEIYDAWHSRICPEALASVEKSVSVMSRGERDENTYAWNHPTLGVRYVRCGGIATKQEDGTTVLDGYHYDVTEQVQEQMEKNLVVNSLANAFVCLFYIDVKKDWYTSYLNNFPDATQYIPKNGKASEALEILVNSFCLPSEVEKAKEFFDLSTIDEHLHDKNSITAEFRGLRIEWAQVTLIVSDRYEDGTVRHLVATVKDISQRMKNELERLEELKENINANRSKTMMIQNMTHEIRTPLNAMFGFAQLLSMPEGCLSDAQKTEYFNYIFNSFNMLTMLIDDVLDISDAEHGNYRIVKSAVQVNGVCRNALQMAEMRLPAGVKMYFTSEVGDDYAIESDARRIQQLLLNYLTNACKHTRQGEIHLHVSLSENPGHLTFSVTDTGEGIPKDMRKDIFLRYKKANAGVQGSGIGLHICNVISSKLGGEIKLDESYETGARFLFIL